MTFAGRLVAGTVAILACALAILVGASEISLRRDLEAEIGRVLEREARLVRAALPADSLEWQAAVRRFAEASGHRITVIDRGGRVRAESDAGEGSLDLLESHADRPEVRQALAGRVGVARRRSATIGRPLLYVAVPGGPGVVRLAATLDQVDEVVGRAQGAVLWAALLAIAVGSAVAFLAGRSVARPLTAITAAARAIAAGETPRFPHAGIPDIDALVAALRAMHDQLAARFRDLQREKAETAALVDAMVEGVIAADPRGRVVTANAAARRLLGYAPDAPLPDLPELFRAKPARAVVDALLRGAPVAGRELRLDGRTLLVSGRPLAAGGAVLLMHDLTEMRQLEAVRRDFVANVSHELKTPLTSISGYAETLLGDEPDRDTARRFVEVILANARRMQRLVDDLLDLSRIESGGWEPRREAVPVAGLAREAWSGLAGRAAAREAALEIDVAPDATTLHADPDAVRQVLTNLFDNSLRHVPSPGGRIVCRAERVEGGVRLAVRDNGGGIPREHLPRIFERFYRADPSRSRDRGGTGLGLAIVKHLVEAHGGRVGAESELGRGTTVWCWFPG
ncbi:MAG TPA: ATP-binding protein [Gemmatimonadales bacterium]|nr:ATP-binding protein [Gemmatimonadales bacterium]